MLAAAEPRSTDAASKPSPTLSPVQTVPLDPLESQSLEALLAFLEGCRLRAQEKGRPQLVSIAARSAALDPLAVLESIYEPRQLHFYVERQSDGFAIAGAEVAISSHPSGAGRFKAARAFIEETLENTVAVGDPALPFFGPHFFCSFGFEAEASAEEAFPASTLFVPSWQVGIVGGDCVAIANVLVEPEAQVEAIAKRIWNANTKFRTISYASASGGVEPPTRLEVLSRTECGGDARFLESVAQALKAIENGDFRKIVLARALDVETNRDLHPLEILNTLRERYADCYAFSIANGKGQSFIGASPERLVSVKEGRVNVDVLAGTAPRGKTASEDAALGGQLLLSEKDCREHAIVFDSIRRRLEALGLRVDQECRPTLKKLQNVQHLHVDLSAPQGESAHLLDLLESLHPTPAVGGTPREAAVGRIKEFEGFHRGLYAGPVGWINAKGEGEFLVAIRSGLIDGRKARFYAGVGIVEGSVPEKEFMETDLKFKALLENLL